MRTIEAGIDTVCYTCSLTGKQKSEIIGNLKMLPHFQTEYGDYFENTYDYTSWAFAKQGIKLRLYRFRGSVWTLFVILHPARLMGNTDRSALFQPAKGELKKMQNQADTVLKQIKFPVKIHKMKLYRVDLTVNLSFDSRSMVEQYLRILKKSRLLPNYHVECFRKGEGKAKDVKKANQHSYKQTCKSAAFFAYDKTTQLEMIEAFPKSLQGKRVLRLEVQLRRKGMKKWVDEKHMDNSVQILKILYQNSKKIIGWYLNRLQVKGTHYVRYEDAAEQIEKVKNRKMRERILYLLRKTSDKHTLSNALEDVKQSLGLSTGQVDRILKKFQKLGISPITLPNADDLDALPALTDFLK